MSVGRFLQQAAAGNAGGATYVDDVFSTYLYDGTGSSLEINNGMDLSGEGGLVWIKGRTAVNATQDHRLVDTARGVNQAVSSSTNDNVLNITGEFTSFDDDGFTLASTSGNGLNRSGEEYCSWTFRNQPGFFQVLTYEGNGTAGRTVSHSLGSVPGCIMVKAAESGVGFNGDWLVYHRGNTAAPETDRLILNSTAATADSNIYWNDTAPTATEFTLGASNDVNGNGVTYVAYIFAHDAQDFGTNSDESIIKCGSYTGDGTSDHSIDIGFEPQWLLVKNTSLGRDWALSDSMRSFNLTQDYFLRPNTSAAESNWAVAEPTATGFRLTDGDDKWNSSGHTFIYVAIRRPHKPASEFAATELYTAAYGVTSPTRYPSGFPVDMATHWDPTSSGQRRFHSRLTGATFLRSDTTGAETASSGAVWDSNTSWADANLAATSTYSYMFRRAPGFFDVVTYTGEIGASGTGHNLGVTPEFIIVKRRNGTSNWRVWHKDLGSTESLILNDTSSVITGGSYFSNPPADADKIYPGGAGDVNTSGVPYITYLFATVAGISKVGSYSGTGSDVDVDCGFTSGARFVLVKRTDSTGDWYLWDSLRGIVAGNDPYIFLNSTAAQVTSTDYIDPLSSGFTITSTAPAALNASGGTYIFLAIA